MAELNVVYVKTIYNQLISVLSLIKCIYILIHLQISPDILILPYPGFSFKKFGTSLSDIRETNPNLKLKNLESIRHA